MGMVLGVARERAAAEVLVEELDHVEAELTGKRRDVRVGDLARARDRQTGGVARPPGGVPVFLPRIPGMRPGHTRGAAGRLEMSSPVIAGEAMADHPAGAVAERPDVPDRARVPPP